MGKKKKEKVIYIDDGRTIADMSGVSGSRLSQNPMRMRSGFKDQWKTYWSAVRMMLKPMLVVIGIICVAYGLLYLFLKFA